MAMVNNLKLKGVSDMLVNRYLKESEIRSIALEVAEAATESRNNAVSNMIRTYFEPVREAAMELYGVDLSRSQTVYIAKLAQIGYVGAIEKHHRDHPMDNPRSGDLY